MKCRYCARVLRVIPHTPSEIEPHCSRPGCRWCVECFRGETLVSPAQEAWGGELFDRAMRYYRTRLGEGEDWGAAGPRAA
jgi:hypothetical protein